MSLMIRLGAVLLTASVAMSAQDLRNATTNSLQSLDTASDKQVPLIVRFGGHLNDVNHLPLTGTFRMTFALYEEETGGSPLWLETQSTSFDTFGHFTVLLGAATAQGIPADVFALGEARWLGISGEDGVVHARIQIASVPYAVEAVNAETLGGKRPEEFLLATQGQGSTQAEYLQSLCTGQFYGSSSSCAPPSIGSPMTGSTFESNSSAGPPFINAGLLNGLSASAFAQQGQTNQFSTSQLFNGGISLVGPPPTARAPQISPPLDFKARAFDNVTNAYQDRWFRWQEEPADNTNLHDRLSLLFGVGSSLPAETGFSINSDGTITFASNQQFPVSTTVSPATGTQGDYSTTYQWQQTPTSGSITAGANTITLAHCPPGVNASDPTLYVYLSGTGPSEAVHVTGGTCKGDGQPGTLQFVAAYAHPTGYTVSSASSGLQESLIAAQQTTQSGSIVVPPGEYPAYAPITIQVSNVTVNFSGSTIDCYASASCIFIGNPTNPSQTVNVTLVSPRGKPMVANGTFPFIEVQGQKTRLQNVTTTASVTPNTFGSYVQVDDDQAFSLDGLDTTGYGLRCDATFCGSYVTAPGPFGVWPAVGWLTNLNISPQCDGNGVDWQSGNGLEISNSVIQGWALFGVRVGNKRGGFGGFVSSNVYYEASASCMSYNPLGNVGLAGIINYGGEVNLEGGAANGVSGIFPNWGSPSGSNTTDYWVVPVHPTFGDGVPLPAGYALSSGVTAITGTFPRVAGASSYKILKMPWPTGGTQPYPEGTGNYLLTTVLQTSCGPQTCQFIDSGQVLSTYSNAGENFSANIYLPLLDFWPGAIVMSQLADTSSADGSIFTPLLIGETLGEGAVVSTLPANILTGTAQTLIPTATPVLAAAGLSGTNTDANSALPGATILKAFTSQNVISNGNKGRENFGDTPRPGGFFPIITLGDSNWGKTWATPNSRPPADIEDLDIGYEVTLDTYYQRAFSEIRNYIGKFPDGNPQESLTATAKVINVPVVINGNLTVTGSCTGCGSFVEHGPVSGVSTNPTSQESIRAKESGPDRYMAKPVQTISITGEATEIAATSLCPASTCEAGQYVVDYYLDSSSSCKLPGLGSVALTIGWTDETSSKTFQVPIVGIGEVDGKHMSLGSLSSFGSGRISFWSSTNAPIVYSTSYQPCGSGKGTYALRMTVTRPQ